MLNMQQHNSNYTSKYRKLHTRLFQSSRLERMYLRRDVHLQSEEAYDTPAWLAIGTQERLYRMLEQSSQKYQSFEELEMF